MKILHLPDSFLPWRTGGKEVFVYNLAVALQKTGVQNQILIHADHSVGANEGIYDYHGLPVNVLAPLHRNYMNQWNKEVQETPGFEIFLLKERPDIIHFHDQNSGASLSHLRIAKKLGIKTVLTYHSPGQSCPQHALLYKGLYTCNGKLDLYKCSRCLLTCKGIPEPFPYILANFNIKIGNYETNKLNRITGQRNLVGIFSNSFHEIYSLHDKIQVHAQWCKKVLMINGVPEKKIFFTRQGIPEKNQESRIKNQETGDYRQETEDRGKYKIKLLFIGRCEWVKGVHVLIEAVKLLPKDFPVEVHFLGPYWDTTNYGKIQLGKIQNDVRFQKPKLLPPSEISSYMQLMDLCIIPSLWPETGPLALLEAFQAGLPVIGSNYGGISENVIDGVNGLLFERNNYKDLARKIQLIINNRQLLNILKKGITSVRTADNMAKDIYQMYCIL